MAFITWYIANDGAPTYVNIIWAVSIILATIFYIVLGIQIYRNRNRPPFNSTYFKLWLNTSIADCLVISCIWIFCRLSGFEWFLYDTLVNYDEYQMAIYYGIVIPILGYLLTVSFFSLVVTSVNRFTSMTYPITHVKVWKLFHFDISNKQHHFTDVGSPTKSCHCNTLAFGTDFTFYVPSYVYCHSKRSNE
jgi:hypothetical protein